MKNKPEIWSWFLVGIHDDISDICHNAKTKLCSICQEECNLAKGHGYSDDYIQEEWLKVTSKLGGKENDR